MKDIAASDLQVGDIILTKGDTPQSKGIRSVTNSQYSHAMLYVGNGKIIEAIGKGVVEQTLTAAAKNVSGAVVLRHSNISDAQRKTVALYAKSKIGRPYDTTGAIGSSTSSPKAQILGLLSPPLVGIAQLMDLANRLGPNSDFYCSELVALAYADAGAPLLPEKRLEFGKSAASTHPGEIHKSHSLKIIGNLVL